jgi:hypothetical protein
MCSVTARAGSRWVVQSLVPVRAGGSRTREPRLAIGGTGAETYAGTGVLAVEFANMAVVIGKPPGCGRGSRNRPIKSSKDRKPSSCHAILISWQLVDKLDTQPAHNQTEYLRVKTDNY